MSRIDALREQQEEYKAEAAIIREFMAHPGWKVLDDGLMNRIRQLRSMEFNNLIDSQDEAFRSSSARGQIVGLITARAHLQTVLDDLDANLVNVANEISEAQDEEE